ncbi:MAG: hypothetical protein ACTSU4_01375 [Promethearchaeota archaeon]
MDIKEILKDFKVPKSIIKKVFPPKTCVSIKENNLIQITGVNVIQPFSLPKEINLGDVDIKQIDPSNYLELTLDGEKIDISPQAINFGEFLDTMKIIVKGEALTIDALLKGTAGGKNIAMGDGFSIEFKMPPSFMEKLTPGKHVLKIDSEQIPNIELEFTI